MENGKKSAERRYVFLSAPRKIFIGSILLFTLIGAAAVTKKGILHRKGKISEESTSKQISLSHSDKEIEPLEVISETKERASEFLVPVNDQLADEEVNEVWRLFTTGKKKLPIVETVRYKSCVPWLKGRSAWVTDYAAHYSTSRHFIARSLNGKKDYDTQKVSPGDQFNILSPDKNLNFYLVVDLSRCKMWFYYHDLDANERVLLKTYRVGLGRFNADSYSGLLTPKGKFLLGDKVATYKPKAKGYFQDSEVEMVQVFGTRWIPLSEQIDGEGDNPRGYGFHGSPWIYNEEADAYVEDLETIGKYSSDGCIRLSREDIEELYSIVITKPTIVEIVSDYKEADMPAIEVER